MLCVRPKVMRVNRQKFQSDVPRIQYGIVGEKGGNIFSAFPSIPIPERVKTVQKHKSEARL